MPAEPEKRRPASRPGIAAAGAICINRDFFHVRRMRNMWAGVALVSATQVECRLDTESTAFGRLHSAAEPAQPMTGTMASSVDDAF
jgi:hypothetical protein